MSGGEFTPAIKKYISKKTGVEESNLDGITMNRVPGNGDIYK
jgi:hypothetical protein